MTTLSGPPVQRHDEPTPLFAKDDPMMAKAEVILSSMSALIILTVLPDSAAAADKPTELLNHLCWLLGRWVSAGMFSRSSTSS